MWLVRSRRSASFGGRPLRADPVQCAVWDRVVRPVLLLVAALGLLLVFGLSQKSEFGAFAQDGDPRRTSPYAPRRSEPAAPPSPVARAGARPAAAAVRAEPARRATPSKARKARRSARRTRSRAARVRSAARTFRRAAPRRLVWIVARQRPVSRTSIRLKGRGVEAYFRHQMEHGR